MINETPKPTPVPENPDLANPSWSDTEGEEPIIMAEHNKHPKIGSAGAGLADGCPRCDDMADDPLCEMDQQTLLALVDRVLEGAWPRSVNEYKAMCEIRAVRDFYRNYFGAGDVV